MPFNSPNLVAFANTSLIGLETLTAANIAVGPHGASLKRLKNMCCRLTEKARFRHLGKT